MLKDYRLYIGSKAIRRGAKHWEMTNTYLERILYDYETMLYVIPAAYHRFIAFALKWAWKIITIGIDKPIYTIKVDW